MNRIIELLKSFNINDSFKISNNIFFESVIDDSEILTFALTHNENTFCFNTICCGAYSSEGCCIKHSGVECPRVSCDDYLKDKPELIKLIILRLEEELLKSL